MGLYTKIDKQLDNYYEVVSINKSLSKQIFYLKVIVLLLLFFDVIMIINENMNTMKLFLYTSHYQSEKV